jgi:hypothetical protein
MLGALKHLVAFVALAAAAACVEPVPSGASGAGAEASTGTSAKTSGTPTYYQDVQPILRAHCTACHKAGEIGSFPIITFDDARSNAAAIAAATTAKKMPPFPPDMTGCAELDDPRIMSDDERAVVAKWVAAGAPEGDSTKPAPDQAIAAEVLGEPTDKWDTGVDYTPNPPAGKQDDYHCFVIDPNVTTAVPYHAVDVAAGNRKIAHHASVFIATTADTVAQAKKLDDAEPGPGYTCFGDTLIESQDVYEIGGWVPGQPPQAFPAKMGGYVKPGNVFILQMHYNIVSSNGPDRPTIRMWRPTEAISEEPNGFDVESYDFSIPARAANISSAGFDDVIGAGDDPTDTQANAGMLWQVGLHEHLLGKAMRMDLVHADGTTSCLLNIPKWDFNWQGTYNLKKPIAMTEGDRIKVTCTWDNSTDKTVEYGNASSDEMCQGWGTTSSPAAAK